MRLFPLLVVPIFARSFRYLNSAPIDGARSKISAPFEEREKRVIRLQVGITESFLQA